MNMPRIKRFEVIRDVFALKRLAEKMKTIEEFAFDTETNSLRCLGPNKDFKFIGLSISWGEYNNYYIPVGHVFDTDQVSIKMLRKYLGPIFEDPSKCIIGWNLKFDMHVLARIGIRIKTIDLFDGMIASWLSDVNTPNGLKENAELLFHAKQKTFRETVASVTNEEKKSVGMKASATATFDLVRIDIGAPYALDDAFYTWEGYLHYSALLEENGMIDIFNKTYRKFIHALFEQEETGVAVDLEKLAVMSKEMDKDIENLTYDILEIAGVDFNPGSSQQVAELLFGFCDPSVYKNPNQKILDNSFHFPVPSFTEKGAPQSSAKSLESILDTQYKNSRKKEGQELVKKLLVLKKINKLKSAFVDGIGEQMYDDKKVHPSFNIIGTTSGRLSCSEPNLQQLPRSLEEDEGGLYELVAKYRIRDIFVGSLDPKTGKRKKIIALDYKNLEMMILAHFSEDHELIDTFMSGGDAHNATAKKMFNLDCDVKDVKKLYPILRQVAKTINFGLMYGMMAYTLYNTLKDSGLDLSDPKYLKEYGVKNGEEVAQIYIDKYFEVYSGVAKFIRDQKKFAHRNGCVYTITGRCRQLPDINSRDFKLVAYSERLAVNAPVQGSAGDVAINAQLRIVRDKILPTIGCTMLIQVHDELVFECPEEHVETAIPILKRYMEHPFGDKVSLNVNLIAEAGFGDSYDEAK